MWILQRIVRWENCGLFWSIQLTLFFDHVKRFRNISAENFKAKPNDILIQTIIYSNISCAFTTAGHILMHWMFVWVSLFHVHFRLNEFIIAYLLDFKVLKKLFYCKVLLSNNYCASFICQLYMCFKRKTMWCYRSHYHFKCQFFTGLSLHGRN